MASERRRPPGPLPADQELLTARYTAEAVKWIEQNKDRPFFLYLAHNMPHAPVFASDNFQGRSAAGRYGDVIEEIDWSVGQVMSALDEAGIVVHHNPLVADLYPRVRIGNPVTLLSREPDLLTAIGPSRTSLIIARKI